MQRIRKLVLAYPNLRWQKEDSTLWGVFPYNLCLLAAAIEGLCDVAIIDGNNDNLSEEGFSAAIAREKPDAVGISVMTDEYGPAGHSACNLVKKLDPRITTIVGGVYASSARERILGDPSVDWVMTGEGEFRLPQWLRYLAGEADLPDGVICRQGSSIQARPMNSFIQDLDAIRLPAYDLIDFPKYANTLPSRPSVDRPRRLPYARMMTSRGCPMGCCFCQVESISGRPFRPRSARNVLDEMEWLRSRYGVRFLMFDDDNLICHRTRASEIFRGMIERKLDLHWNAIAMSAGLLTEPLLDLMKMSGCDYLDLAIESGVQRVLDEIIHKPLKIEHARRIVGKARALQIDTVINIVIGFPGETWDEIRQTLSFAEELDADYVKVFIANPLPGTRLEKLAQETGSLVGDTADVGWRYGKIKTSHFNPQDLAILRAYEWDRINFTQPEKRQKIAEMLGISNDELEKQRKQTRWSLRFGS